MRELLEFAKKMLGAYGEFHPFAGCLQSPTKMVHVGVELSEGGGHAWNRIEALYASLQKESAHALAFGVVSNVRLPDDVGSRDAVKIFLEHKGGYCADVFFCYDLTRENGLKFTETFAQEGRSVFFASNRS